MTAPQAAWQGGKVCRGRVAISTQCSWPLVSLIVWALVTSKVSVPTSESLIVVFPGPLSWRVAVPSTSGPKSRIQRTLHTMEQFLPGARANFVRGSSFSWQDHPWVGGAWAS